MSLTESSGRLTRWQLRLAEYDFTIQYRPGRVHQVPDALSRLVSPQVANDPRPTVEVDDDIPTFDGTRQFETYRTSSQTTLVPRAVIVGPSMSS